MLYPSFEPGKANTFLTCLCFHSEPCGAVGCPETSTGLGCTGLPRAGGEAPVLN